MNQRNVCMIAYANYFTDARIKNYVYSLITEGFEVDVFALGNDPTGAPAGVRVFSLMEKHWGNRAFGYIVSQLWFALSVFVLVTWHFFRRGYCFVHVHNMPNFLVLSAMVPKVCGSKLILDVHDTMPETFATKFGVELGHPLIRMLKWEERISAWLADQVITTNDLHKQVLCSHGIPAAKIGVIMNVGNDQIFHPMPDQSQGEQDGLLLVYHGTIAERLGIDLILDALNLTRTACEDVRLLLIGEGDFMPKVRELVKSLDLTKEVEITGFIPVEQLPRYLSHADVGIVGIRGYYQMKENYGLPVKMLEYAAMEIPTIAPRLRVISHYFDETSAFFYTPDDAQDMARQIVETYHHRERIIQVKRRLKIFNQRYNWPFMEGTYLGIVESLTGGDVANPARGRADERSLAQIRGNQAG